MRAALVGCLFFVNASISWGNHSPGPNFNSVKFIDKIGTIALQRYCLEHLPLLVFFSTYEKENVVLTKDRDACFVILYEFATASGPAIRYFYRQHAYTSQFINGPGFRWVLEKTISFKDTSHSEFEVSPCEYLPYPFSAVPYQPSTWAFGLAQHYKTLRQHNLPQFILGSFAVRVDRLSNLMSRFTITNFMSRKSLFLHIVRSVSRPLPLGTTKQVLTIVLSNAEIIDLLKP